MIATALGWVSTIICWTIGVLVTWLLVAIGVGIALGTIIRKNPPYPVALPIPQEAGQHIKPPVGTTVHNDGDESGRLVTFQPDGHWGPATPEVKSCKREAE